MAFSLPRLEGGVPYGTWLLNRGDGVVVALLTYGAGGGGGGGTCGTLSLLCHGEDGVATALGRCGDEGGGGKYG